MHVYVHVHVYQWMEAASRTPSIDLLLMHFNIESLDRYDIRGVCGTAPHVVNSNFGA